MEKSTYSSNDIAIGDEILFEGSHNVEHNLCWKVINFFSPDRVMVEIKDMGYAEKLIVDIRDIILLQRSGLQMEQISC